MKKIFKNPIFTFILGAIIFGSIGVVSATILYQADEIGFTPSDPNWNVNNLESALNDLYDNKDTIDFENIELIHNYNSANSSISIEPSDYKFFVLTDTYWDSSSKIYSSAIQYLSIATITNGAYYTSGLTGRNGSASCVAGRSYIIVPDGSGNTITVTFSGTSDATSIYGIK